MAESFRESTKNLLVIMLSFFLGLFLFLFSFIFLYFNEIVGEELLSGKTILTEDKSIINSAKIITLEAKKTFLSQGSNNYSAVEGIFRGIGFFMMFFGLTLFLITIKGRKNIYGFISFIVSLIGTFIVILLSKIYLGFKSGDLSFDKFSFDLFKNGFGDFFDFDFHFDVFLVLGVIFLIFLVLSVFYGFFGIFKEEEKNPFKGYKKK